MQNITFKLSNLHHFGAAYFDYLKLRKQFFVDQLNWDIAHDDDYEMDQYDNPLARYSLVVKDGKVIGGARAMPTTSQWGKNTYMLKDSYRGMLPGIPEDVLGRDVTNREIWECTRVVISDDVTTHAERAECLRHIVEGLVGMVNVEGGTEMMCLSPPTFVRALRQLGFDCERIGEPYRCEDDGRKYAVLRMPARSSLKEKPAHTYSPTPKSVVRNYPLPEHA